jgi:uncharacterized membrane protein
MQVANILKISGSGVAGSLATLGAVAAGVAFVEAALVPAVLVGGAAMLAPRLFPNDMVKGVKHRLRRWTSPTEAPSATTPARGQAASFDVWRAVTKTVTYRVALTTVDFGANYFVIGELATAAGLSGLSLFAGPIFYFAHEAAWHHYGQQASNPLEPQTATADGNPSQALAKTVTYEGVTAVSEFAVNYFVVRDFAAAAGLAAFSVVVSPFVYYAHEKAWEYFDASKSKSPETRPLEQIPVF